MKAMGLLFSVFWGRQNIHHKSPKRLDRYWFRARYIKGYCKTDFMVINFRVFQSCTLSETCQEQLLSIKHLPGCHMALSLWRVTCWGQINMTKDNILPRCLFTNSYNLPCNLKSALPFPNTEGRISLYFSISLS